MVISYVDITAVSVTLVHVPNVVISLDSHFYTGPDSV
jgi:hypothetical protein